MSSDSRFQQIQVLNRQIERIYPQELFPQYFVQNSDLNSHQQNRLSNELVTSANQNNSDDQFRKLLTVFTFLIDEMKELIYLAKNKFYPNLTMFGKSPIEMDVHDDEIMESSTLYKQTGIKEEIMGMFISSTLQDLSNFINRCKAIVLNSIQQLSAVYYDKSTVLGGNEQGFNGLLGAVTSAFSHQNTNYNSNNMALNGNSSSSPFLNPNTYLTSIFTSIGEILSMLLTLDMIINQNEFLRESWELYKSMLAYRRSDPVVFNTVIESRIEIDKFERMIFNIDTNVSTT